MANQDTLQTMEQSAYRRAYSDGIIDLFVGLCLIWIGSIWILLPDYGGLAGIIPAVLAPAMIPIRKQYVESRLGYVRWSEPRRSKERRNVIAMVVVGLVLFLTGIGVFALVDRSQVDQGLLDLLAPGLLAWLLALIALGLAFLTDAWRFVVYAIALVAGGLVAGIQGSNPGWPLVWGGAVMAIVGSVMLSRFSRQNPKQEEA